MMKKVSVILFVFGAIVQIASFAVSNAESIPLVLRLLAPQFAHARAALDLLDDKKHLEPGDPGFPNLEQIIRQRMSEDNDPSNVAKVQMTRIWFGDITISPEVQQRNIRIGLSNGQAIDYNIKQIVSRVDLLKQKNFLLFGGLLFALGLLLAAIGFKLEMRASQKK